MTLAGNCTQSEESVVKFVHVIVSKLNLEKFSILYLDIALEMFNTAQSSSMIN